MLSLSYDLHIHSCLSPCGDNESTPVDIVGMAFVKGLDVVALTDHNSAENCPAAKEAADAYGVCFIPGMEITTEEEVHVVCLLPTVEKALELSRYVYDKLLDVKNDPAVFGDQLIMNSDDQVIGTKEKLLINATSISFSECFSLAESFGGVAIPAHIDKQANSLLANLGFVPPDCNFSTCEVRRPENFTDIKKQHPYFENCRMISDSDAHYLQDINEPVNFLHAEEKTAQAVINALRTPFVRKGDTL